MLRWRYGLSLIGWMLMTLGAFAVASPVLPKYSDAQRDDNFVVNVLVGIALIAAGFFLVRFFRER